MGLRGPKSRPTIDRFLARVRPVPDGCWHWTGNISNKGYGRMGLGPHDTGLDRWVTGYAHRWSYEYYVGPIPDGLVIDHRCGVTRCVNPGHLRAISFRDNILAGRGEMVALHHLAQCRNGHDMTDSTHVYIRPDNGRRMCRTCQRDRKKAKPQVAVAA